MSRTADRQSVQDEINEIFRQLGPREVANVFKAADLARKLSDMAESGPFKPGGELSESGPFKPGGELARLFGSDGSGLVNLAALAELATASAALDRARAITADLREVQGTLSGEPRARLQKAINNLETELATVAASYRSSVEKTSASPGTSVASRDGRAVHIHLHLGA